MHFSNEYGRLKKYHILQHLWKSKTTFSKNNLLGQNQTLHTSKGLIHKKSIQMSYYESLKRNEYDLYNTLLQIKKIMQTLSLCHDYLPAIKTRWMILFDWAFYKPHVYQLTSNIYDSWVICTSSAKGQRWPLVLLSLLCQGH